MLVNGDVPFLRVPFFEPISDLWVSFLASSGFLGAILSPLRIYGYTFEKKLPQNNFSCLAHARHSCQCLTRALVFCDASNFTLTLSVISFMRKRTFSLYQPSPVPSDLWLPWNVLCFDVRIHLFTLLPSLILSGFFFG